MKNLINSIKNTKDAESAVSILYSIIDKADIIDKALEFATKYHKGQYRKSGEEYIVHPILAASLVAYFGGDKDMVASAILHDVVEDTECEMEEIEREFGEDIGKLVYGLTKIGEIRDRRLIPSTSNEKIIASALTFRKMLLVSIKDVRVLVVKLCDRLHNMLTLDSLSQNSQKRIAEETLVVYAPIAHRLGISTIKNTLEDLCFRYVMPKENAEIENYIKKHKQQIQLKLNHFISKTRNYMLKNGFIDGQFTINKRIKHNYSIYLKMQRKGISIEEVLDLLAIRILVETPNDCYRALGIIHLNFKPLISRFKDYVSIPKDNGYQTIHTTVFDDKSIIEAQIRTYDMNKTAEYGVAAHWKYKGYSGLTPKLEWLNDLKLQQEESENIEEFYELAKKDLYSEEISVFSPKGDLFTLPRGATALDFAYAVHTDIGHRTKYAYINKNRMPLLTALKNGDIVRIETVDELIIRCSWISSVKTAKAKNSIKIGCKQKIKEIDKKCSINILKTIFNTSKENILLWLGTNRVENKIHKATTDAAYLQELIYHLKKSARMHSKFIPVISPFTKSKLKIQKFDNIEVYSPQNYSNVIFDYCCHPKRYDDIVGFKNSNEVTIHHKLCKNAQKLIDEGKQMVFVKWVKEILNRYKLIASIENKKGSLATFLQFLAKMDINVLTIELGKTDEGHVDFFDLTLELPDKDIENIKRKIAKRYKTIELIPLDDAYKGR